MSINRSSFKPELHTPHRIKDGRKVYSTHNGEPLPPIPLEVFSTTNPSGVGRNAVKKRFIDPQSYPGEVIERKITYYDNKKKEDITVVRRQVAIFGSFFENDYLDPVYKAGLMEACENDPNKRLAWIEGSWDATEGGAVDDLWNHKYHVIPRFPIPSNWKVDRVFDWGSSHPFNLHWFAEANGETVRWVDKLGREWTWTPPNKSLILIQERYGEGEKAHTGLRWSAGKIADHVNDIERALYMRGWIKSAVQAGPADNQIWDVTQSDVEKIAEKMAAKGVYFTRSDKSKGSLVTGLELTRERLANVINGEGPGFYIMAHCQKTIEYFPSLPRDPDDLEKVADCPFDHMWDTIRYRVLRGSNKIAKNLELTFGR